MVKRDERKEMRETSISPVVAYLLQLSEIEEVDILLSDLEESFYYITQQSFGS